MARLIDDGMIRIGRFQIHKTHCLGVDERAFYDEAPDFYLNEFANRKLRDMDMILEISCMSKESYEKGEYKYKPIANKTPIQILSKAEFCGKPPHPVAFQNYGAFKDIKYILAAYEVLSERENLTDFELGIKVSIENMLFAEKTDQEVRVGRVIVDTSSICEDIKQVVSQKEIDEKFDLGSKIDGVFYEKERIKCMRAKQIREGVCAVLKNVIVKLALPARKIGELIGRLFTGKSENSNENDNQSENE